MLWINVNNSEVHLTSLYCSQGIVFSPSDSIQSRDLTVMGTDFVFSTSVLISWISINNVSSRLDKPARPAFLEGWTVVRVLQHNQILECLPSAGITLSYKLITTLQRKHSITFSSPLNACHRLNKVLWTQWLRSRRRIHRKRTREWKRSTMKMFRLPISRPPTLKI